MTVDYVDAIFGGKRVRFRMGPRALQYFESMQGSARACLQRFIQNSWTIADMKAVLGVSHPDLFTAWGTIDAVLARNKPGTYAGLATTILVAALTGIDEESATFDEAA